MQQHTAEQAIDKLADADGVEFFERMSVMREREQLASDTMLLNASADILTNEASKVVQMMETGVIPACAQRAGNPSRALTVRERDVVMSTVAAIEKEGLYVGEKYPDEDEASTQQPHRSQEQQTGQGKRNGRKRNKERKRKRVGRKRKRKRVGEKGKTEEEVRELPRS